ncbi:G5 domain-containing protein [Lysinibacillus sp. NPDC097287]|uniref:G5 domain-containing protein n=1 Tax=Lysinibacillus sp. NPDC097287 TaxID=3364144 RepID=UPI003806B0C3
MKRAFQLGSLVVIILLCIAVFLPNALLNDTVFAKGDSEGSTIGGIEVTKVKKSALESTLQTAINEWVKTAVVVSDGENTITIDGSELSFDIQTAISQFETMTKKPWYAIWQKNSIVHIPIPVTVNEAAIEQIKELATWESDKTLSNVMMQASYLDNHEVEAVVNDLDMQMEERIGFQVEEIPTGALGITDVIASLNDVVLVPNNPVSLLTLLGEQAEVVNTIGLDFLASMIYSTVLQTDYEILERHSQKETPTYLQQGIEASINKSLNKDLQFINLSEQPGKLKVTTKGKSLKVEMFSTSKEKDINIRVEKDRIVNPRTIYRYSDEIAIGQEEVVQEGKVGVRVEVYRSIVENGVSSEVLVSRDYYAPINQIVVRSSKQPATDAGDSETTNLNDPDLQLDLDGNGLADPPKQPSTNTGNKQPSNDPDIVYGYYDKGGNFVQTSP